MRKGKGWPSFAPFPGTELPTRTDRAGTHVMRLPSREVEFTPITDAVINKLIKQGKPKRHDHRQSSWLIAGGVWMWCYRCGAIRLNRKYEIEGGKVRTKWIRPTGPDGKNPA